MALPLHVKVVPPAVACVGSGHRRVCAEGMMFTLGSDRGHWCGGGGDLDTVTVTLLCSPCHF